MGLRIGFSFTEEMNDDIGCERDSVQTFYKIIEKYQYTEFTDLFHKILKEVDRVEMIALFMFKTDYGKVITLDKLSNTCRNLLCLLLDKDGYYKIPSSRIGDGYHHLLDDISVISNAILIVDWDLKLFIGKSKGKILSGCSCETFESLDYDNKYTRGIRDYVEQSMNHYCLWQFHDDFGKLQYNNPTLILKENLFNKWSGYHSIYWDTSEGEYYD